MEPVASLKDKDRLQDAQREVQLAYLAYNAASADLRVFAERAGIQDCTEFA